MGNEASSRRRKNTRGYERMPIEFQNITDNYTSIEQVQQGRWGLDILQVSNCSPLKPVPLSTSLTTSWFRKFEFDFWY